MSLDTDRVLSTSLCLFLLMLVKVAEAPGTGTAVEFMAGGAAGLLRHSASIDSVT